MRLALRVPPRMVLVLLCSADLSLGSQWSAYLVGVVGGGPDQYEAIIFGYSGSGGAVSIPASVDGYPVIQIGGSPDWPYPIFGADNTTVTSVVIPDGVRTIGINAFVGALAMRDVTIPNSVTDIDVRAFGSCVGLTNVTIPYSVTRIGPEAFSGCAGLTNIIIGPGVTTIEDYAFSNCDNLASVVIPNSVTNIGVRAFQSCPNLSKLTIGTNVTTIGYRAFSFCLGLTNVTIPKSVVEIGARVFDWCRALRYVYFEGNPPSIIDVLFDDEIFGGITPVGTVYYSPGAVGWGSTFSSWPTQIIAPTASAISYAPSTGFQFSWSGAASIPMNVRRTTSLGGSWTVVSTNNATGQFVDTNPPSGKAFYQAYLP